MSNTPQISSDSFQHGKFKFVFIKDYSPITIDLLKNHDAVIIDGVNQEYIERTLFKNRSEANRKIQMIPVFVLKTTEITSKIIKALIDGTIYSKGQIDHVAAYTEHILNKVNQFHRSESLNFENEILNSLIKFMVSREKKHLVAIPDPNSRIGYTYPEAAFFFDKTEAYRILNLMEDAEKKGLVTSKFNELAYLCPNCHSGIFSYREVCPKCSSSNSDTEDLVHHFPCAYVGPMSDFTGKKNDRLVCPKCDRTLNHIGVDYDKPSVLHHCNNCEHDFQDYFVKARCLSCLQDNEVENLIARKIKDYELTQKGENIAYQGFDKEIEGEKIDVPGTVDFTIFKTLLRYEIERTKNPNYSSQIASIYLANSNELSKRIGFEKRKNILIEIINFLNKKIKSTDFITLYNSTTIIFTYNDTLFDEAQN